MNDPCREPATSKYRALYFPPCRAAMSGRPWLDCGPAVSAEIVVPATANCVVPRSCPMGFSSLGVNGRRDEVVAHLADAVGPGHQLVADLQQQRWLTGPADAARRAGEDQVAGQQRQHPGQKLHELRDREDQVARAAMLHLLAVDKAAKADIAGIGEFVGSDQR